MYMSTDSTSQRTQRTEADVPNGLSRRAGVLSAVTKLAEVDLLDLALTTLNSAAELGYISRQERRLMFLLILEKTTRN